MSLIALSEWKDTSSAAGLRYVSENFGAEIVQNIELGAKHAERTSPSEFHTHEINPLASEFSFKF